VEDRKGRESFMAVVSEVDGPDVLQTGSSNIQLSGNRGRLRDRVNGLSAVTRLLFGLNWTARELLRAVLGDGGFDAGDVRFGSVVVKGIHQCKGFVLPLFQQRSVLGAEEASEERN
jgi:hypothetical protein